MYQEIPISGAVFRTACITFLVLLSGCTQLLPKPEDEVVQSRYGLGLDIPPESKWPPPGPFYEPREELDYWYNTLIDSYDEIVGGCREPPSMRLSYSIGRLIEHTISCAPDYEGLKAIAADIERTGDGSILHQMRNESLDKRRMAHDALTNSSSIGYSNISTVEVVALLMWLYMTNEGNEEMVAGYYHSYLNGTYDGELYKILVQYQILERSSRAILNVYPYIGVDGSCRAPDRDLGAEAISRTKQLMATYEDDERLPGTTTLFGYGALKHYLFYEETANEYGWWPNLLGSLSSQAAVEAYFENLGAERLPNFEEGRYLHALLANETRSIWTDRWLEDFYPEPLEEFNWYYTPEPALQMLSRSAVEWRFSEVECQ